MRDDAGEATPLELPARKGTRVIGAIFGLVFLVFALILWSQVEKIPGNASRGIFELTSAIFSVL